jgi:hypothetical protein
LGPEEKEYAGEGQKILQEKERSWGPKKKNVLARDRKFCKKKKGLRARRKRICWRGPENFARKRKILGPEEKECFGEGQQQFIGLYTASLFW